MNLSFRNGLRGLTVMKNHFQTSRYALGIYCKYGCGEGMMSNMRREKIFWNKSYHYSKNV